MIFNGTHTFLLKTILLLANKNVTEPEKTEVVVDSFTEIPTNTLYKMENDGEEVEDRCYAGIGCYSINKPWTDTTRPVSYFPEPPEKVSPKYCLYTRRNPLQCEQLVYSDPSTIYKSDLIPTHQIYFLAHGFLEGGDRPWVKNLTGELLRRADVNVVVIDWGSGSSPPYTQAVANIRLVGTISALLIKEMVVQVGVNTKYVHVIGHSLGAHLSGYIGNTLKTRFGLTLGRITGLDPAEPHFQQTDPVVRLDPTDALFVDIIHSDATPFIKGGLGMHDPVGHLDFYPNGGEDQPGCNEGMMKYINKEKGSFFKGIRLFLGCDHVRSHEYFMESVNTHCDFLAIECDTWENFLAGKCFQCKTEQNNGSICARFGLDSVHSVRTSLGHSWKPTDRTHVKLYTITGPSFPFCRALYRVTTVISNSNASIEHGGEVGMFSIEIVGIKGRTNVLNLYTEQYYKPGSLHRQVVAGSSVGRITSGILHWTHRTTLNFLTWRLDNAVLHLKYVRVDSLEESQTIYLCPTPSEKMISRKPVTLKQCPDHIVSITEEIV